MGQTKSLRPVSSRMGSVGVGCVNSLPSPWTGCANVLLSSCAGSACTTSPLETSWLPRATLSAVEAAGEICLTDRFNANSGHGNVSFSLWPYKRLRSGTFKVNVPQSLWVSWSSATLLPSPDSFSSTEKSSIVRNSTVFFFKWSLFRLCAASCKSSPLILKAKEDS